MRRPLVVVCIVLGAILVFLLALSLLNNKPVFKETVTQKAATPVPTESVRTKLFRTGDAHFQFIYPEKWFVVDTTAEEASPSLDLLQTWTVSDSSTGWRLQARFRYKQTRNNFQEMKSMTCQQERDPCQTITINSLPYRKTEVSQQGWIITTYQTLYEDRLLWIEVRSANGTEQAGLLQNWDRIAASFRFF